MDTRGSWLGRFRHEGYEPELATENCNDWMSGVVFFEVLDGIKHDVTDQVRAAHLENWKNIFYFVRLELEIERDCDCKFLAPNAEEHHADRRSYSIA